MLVINFKADRISTLIARYEKVNAIQTEVTKSDEWISAIGVPEKWMRAQRLSRKIREQIGFLTAICAERREQ